MLKFLVLIILLELSLCDQVDLAFNNLLLDHPLSPALLQSHMCGVFVARVFLCVKMLVCECVFFVCVCFCLCVCEYVYCICVSVCVSVYAYVVYIRVSVYACTVYVFLLRECMCICTCDRVFLRLGSSHVMTTQEVSYFL
jgi:hypothetical protein